METVIMTRSVHMPFGDEECDPVHLELEIDRDIAVPELAPDTVPCKRCGAPLAHHASACMYCSASVVPRAPIPAIAPAPLSYAPPPPAFVSLPVTRADRVLDAMGALPYDFWKRVAFYPFLALVLGNALTCRGFSLAMNLALVVLAVMGIVGVVASLRQRSW
jgi:hypothetical protein